MDDFAALKSLKGLSLRNPSNPVERKDAANANLSTLSYVSSSTTQAVAESKRESNLSHDRDRTAKQSGSGSGSGSGEPKSDESEPVPFDYYNNAYQRYMAAHGGLSEGNYDDDNNNNHGDGDGDGASGGGYVHGGEGEERFGYFGGDGDDGARGVEGNTPRDEVEGRRSGM